MESTMNEEVRLIDRGQLNGDPISAISRWGGCFVVLTDNKVRVKAPQSES
jgi:hypothetical protein